MVVCQNANQHAKNAPWGARGAASCRALTGAVQEGILTLPASPGIGGGSSCHLVTEVRQCLIHNISWRHACLSTSPHHTRARPTAPALFLHLPPDPQDAAH